MATSACYTASEARTFPHSCPQFHTLSHQPGPPVQVFSLFSTIAMEEVRVGAAKWILFGRRSHGEGSGDLRYHLRINVNTFLASQVWFPSSHMLFFCISFEALWRQSNLLSFTQKSSTCKEVLSSELLITPETSLPRGVLHVAGVLQATLFSTWRCYFPLPEDYVSRYLRIEGLCW